MVFSVFLKTIIDIFYQKHELNRSLVFSEFTPYYLDLIFSMSFLFLNKKKNNRKKNQTCSYCFSK